MRFNDFLLIVFAGDDMVMMILFTVGRVGRMTCTFVSSDIVVDIPCEMNPHSYRY